MHFIIVVVGYRKRNHKCSEDIELIGIRDINVSMKSITKVSRT